MPIEITAAGFLFDMDGTLVDSHAVVEQEWTHFAADHGLDAAEILAVSHGVQAIDTVRRFLPERSDDEQRAIAAELVRRETADTAGVVEIPGAAAVMDALLALDAPVALVTSAPRDLALVRLAAAGVAVPPVVVTAEDVERGKPHPDAYLAAAAALGLDAADCAAFEDAEAGLLSAVASGARTVVVGAHASATTEPLVRLADYTGVAVDRAADGVASWLISRR